MGAKVTITAPDFARADRAWPASHSTRAHWPIPAIIQRRDNPTRGQRVVGPLLRRFAELDISADYPERISPATRDQTLRFVRETSSALTPPTVLPDEDGAVLHWVVDGESLVVHIEDDGPALLWASCGGSPIAETEVTEIRRVAQLLLASFAQKVRADMTPWAPERILG